MEIDLKNIPYCFIHKREIQHICSCSACNISNSMICGDPQCMKIHAHPMQQIIPVAKLDELFKFNTTSMAMLIKKTKDYYRQIRQFLNHEIQKIQQMMTRALQYKHTHPVITLFKQQKYNQITPQKMTHLLSYLRGAKTERKTMEFIKNQIYQNLQKLQAQRKKLIEGIEFKKLMLLELIDLNSTHQMAIQNVNTNILENQEQFKTISKMLSNRHKKVFSSWQLLYRASEHEYSAQSYMLSIQGRGPLLMIFKTESQHKFGCYINCKVNKKEGWITDGPGFSFIFSLDHDQMYPIKQQAKFRVKAFYIGNKGPQIGSGCDIYISDKCNQNQESGSNLGGSYQLPSKVSFGSKQAQQLLAGSKNYKIVQYQVYQVK